MTYDTSTWTESTQLPRVDAFTIDLFGTPSTAATLVPENRTKEPLTDVTPPTGDANDEEDTPMIDRGAPDQAAVKDGAQTTNDAHPAGISQPDAGDASTVPEQAHRNYANTTTTAAAFARTRVERSTWDVIKAGGTAFHAYAREAVIGKARTKARLDNHQVDGFGILPGTVIAYLDIGILIRADVISTSERVTGCAADVVDRFLAEYVDHGSRIAGFDEAIGACLETRLYR